MSIEDSDNSYPGKDPIVTMRSKWKVYQEDGCIVLQNMATKEKQFINVFEETIEFESNGRIGALVVALDRQTCREQFN